MDLGHPRPLRCATAVLALFAAVWLGLAYTTNPATGSPDRAPRGGPAYALERVGTFDSPTYVDSAPGRPQLLFVTELAGVVRVLRQRRAVVEPFLDISAHVSSGGESGLLSIAFDPGYAKNRRFYVAYVDTANDLRVDRFRTSAGDPARALPETRRKVIVVQHPRVPFHYGGQLEFGPDGSLYLSTGEGTWGKPAQDPASLLGKVLRIAPRARGGYTAVSGNPYIGTAGADEVFALGLRNPSRFSFDGHDLWIADVGEDHWEEINRVSLPTAAGVNFGWNIYEGNHPLNPGVPAPMPASYQPPIHEYPNDDQTCAVIGGYVVRDTALRGLLGRYVYSDFCDGILRALSLGPGATPARAEPLGLRVQVPTSFGEGVRGRIYVASLDGPVFQLVQTGP